MSSSGAGGEAEATNLAALCGASARAIAWPAIGTGEFNPPVRASRISDRRKNCGFNARSAAAASSHSMSAAGMFTTKRTSSAPVALRLRGRPRGRGSIIGDLRFGAGGAESNPRPELYKNPALPLSYAGSEQIIKQFEQMGAAQVRLRLQSEHLWDTDIKRLASRWLSEIEEAERARSNSAQAEQAQAASRAAHAAERAATAAEEQARIARQALTTARAATAIAAIALIVSILGVLHLIG